MLSYTEEIYLEANVLLSLIDCGEYPFPRIGDLPDIEQENWSQLLLLKDLSCDDLKKEFIAFALDHVPRNKFRNH